MELRGKNRRKIDMGRKKKDDYEYVYLYDDEDFDEEEEDDDDDDDGESLSVWEAADIWLSNGMDEDSMFGYTEEELRRALK